MSLVVVGSVALDTIQTPQGGVEEVLGGSAVHFALAASLFTRVHLVGVVGTDMPEKYLEVLRRDTINLDGLQRRPGRTFRWAGRYFSDMDTRETLRVELNVFGEFEPDVPPAHRRSPFLFLANGSPAHQLRVLDQMPEVRFAALDTMDHWIESDRPTLKSALRRAHAAVVNEGEAELLTGERHLAAARRILEMGPACVVVKKGVHGAVLVTAEDTFLIPAYPVARVKDPTGAGDAFAGGMMGWLARSEEVTPQALRRGIACGTVIASFNVEDFGVRRLAGLTREEVDRRMAEFRDMLAF